MRRVLADKMKRLGPLPLAHDPGAQWTYGMSSDVLGRVIEVASGDTLDRHLARTIFEPLAMCRTSFFVPENEREAVVSRYSHADGTLRARPRDLHPEDARYLSGGGGLHTTIGDYARFAQALLDDGGPILSRPSVDTMTTNQIGNLG
jgi:CubicO group peptidase (beta-lactamase class C family)